LARTRSEGFESERHRIADLAVRSFAESGYASATMGAIARECGISKANLYHYFSGKDALLFHALERYTERLEALGRDENTPVEGGNDSAPGTTTGASGLAAARERLNRILERFVVAYCDAAHYHKALLNDVHHLPAPARERIRGLERQIVAHFQHAILKAHPELGHHPHLGALTMSLLGMLNFSFAWWRPEGGLSAKAFAQELALLWDGALRARTARTTKAYPEELSCPPGRPLNIPVQESCS
jgi:AcrR family transcriptional regulator